MLRRTLFGCENAKNNITDWSGKVEALMKDLSQGKCFDKTVLTPTIIPTMHLQKSLFRLPIPALEKTTERYLHAVKPIVTPEQYNKTETIVKDFAKKGGEGAALHEELVKKDKANPHTSFISDDWFDLYLSDRTPLPIHYNPSLVTRMDTDKPDGLLRATFWIASTCRWFKMYHNRTIKPEVFYFGKNHYSRGSTFSRFISWVPESLSAKAMTIGSNFHAFPIDMSQYDNLFNSTRIPGPIKDTIKSSAPASHIVVNYRGNQYKVTVSDANTLDPLPECQIYARLQQIVKTNPAKPKVDVGVFTSMKREDWASVRTSMLRDHQNSASFDIVDSAMFVVDLDLDTTLDLVSQPGAVAANRHFIVDNKNRWWDKSVSVIVDKTGTLGVNFEHSWGDGVAVLRYTVDCFNDSISRSSVTMGKDAPATEPVQQLKWNLSPSEIETGERALKRLTDEMNRMDYCIGVQNNIGKRNKIFRGTVKPDPFMQMAMQLAWWRLNKSTVSTYESASTAAFKKGRTECIRSATNESKNFTMSFDNPKLSNEEKMELLVKASKKHTALSKDAKMGNGIDRHLFALKKIAERRGSAPCIFRDASYASLCSNMISTSSLYSDALIGGGFGPVSAGYGVGYASADEEMVFSVSSWKQEGPNHSAQDFAAAVYEACDDMTHILSKQRG
eukprot:Tbor_TRINITY_DN5127_c0_g1::TRINITY_DN5127_c0_g1_i1::g.26046::m.26046/K08766/CPT2; carnitine O-palmitoyltransferase 2